MSLTLKLVGLSGLLGHLDDYDAEERLGKAVDKTRKALRGFLASRTPVITGSMRRAWYSEMGSPLEGRVFIDPAATNTRSGALVSSYAPGVADRYGLMDAALTQGEKIADAALEEAFDGF